MNWLGDDACKILGIPHNQNNLRLVNAIWMAKDEEERNYYASFLPRIPFNLKTMPKQSFDLSYKTGKNKNHSLNN